MPLPFNLPDPPAPFQKKLDLAKMNKKVKKEKAVPVVPPGVALRPPGFFLPLQEVKPLVEPTPAPVVFISNVLQAQIDERARARKALAEAKAREANGQIDGQDQPNAPSPDDKPSRKKSKKEKEEEQMKKKEQEMKSKPQYPMTQYKDRDDHPTYKGHFLQLQKQRGNIRVVGPEYCFGLAERNLEVDYEAPRAAPRPSSPPLFREYPVSPRASNVPLTSDSPSDKDGTVNVDQAESPPFVPKFKPRMYVADVTKWPAIPHNLSNLNLCDVILPTLYSDYPTELRADLIPPAPGSEDHIIRKREQLAKKREEMVAHEVEREVARRTHLPSETSADSTSINSFHTTTVSSETTERTSPSEAYFPHRAPQDRGAHGNERIQKPFTPFVQPASERGSPSEINFSPPSTWMQKRQQDAPSPSKSQRSPEYAGSKTTKVFHVGGAVNVSKLMLSSDARLKEGPSSHQAVVGRSPSTSSSKPEYQRPVTPPPRVPRPPQATHSRTSSRKAIYFTAEQIMGSASPISPPPPTPPPKDSPYLAQIPPYRQRAQQKELNPNPPTFGRRSPSPTPGPAFATTLPLRVHKRNPSNPVAQNPRNVFDYASVTTSRAGPKPQGPPPVLRHRGHLRMITPPPRLESLPINVKSNARPSMSTTTFRTQIDHEIRAGHNRSASEMATRPQRHVVKVARPEHGRSVSALGHYRRDQMATQPQPRHIVEVARPEHGRSASALGHYRDPLTRPPVYVRPDVARSQSPSMSTPNYGARPYVSSTTNGKSRVLPGQGHTRMASEFGHIQPSHSAVRAQRTLPHRHYNTATGLEHRPGWI